ncbi:response regulator [Cohnella thailandensis]|uniref:Response regulator n=1 Tax=Cohnella thailandensis TaxID=557557 RepID=A0A841T1M4_9BACL|nr:response regulator [Cohnella thailandensis]MBB6637452.1 response regulator [Cohnella thailandensis]MBP1977828.1 two-component system response regulator YesN [Cohnella thailandensis]
MSMYRVLLVDDEPEVRSGLRYKIDWAKLGFEIAGEAGNGREALEALERERPHLMLTDIRMPTMGGLELLKQCEENYPRLRTVVLSGHDEFHYVKTAMQCGARDYLLKPVVRLELTNLLAKLKEELDREREASREREAEEYRRRQSLPHLREQLLLEWIRHDGEEGRRILRDEAKRLGMTEWLNESSRIRFLCAEYRLREGRIEGASDSGLFRLAFRMLCRELTEAPPWEGRAFAFSDRGHHRFMYFLVRSDDEGQEERIVRELAERVQTSVRTLLRAECVIGIGAPAASGKDMRAGYLSALTAWSRSLPGADSQICADGEAESPLAEGHAELERRLSQALENGDEAGFGRLLEAATESGGRQQRHVAAALFRTALLLEQVARRHGIDAPEAGEWMLPDSPWPWSAPAEARARLTGIAARIAERIRAGRATNGTEVVEAIRRDIEEGYMHELALSTMAERYHLNLTYLSELFKKQLGITFSDYVVQVRLRHAEQLLRDPAMRLADIAELSGFSTASYLSSVFKKHYGVSPSEFRSGGGEGAGG